MEIFWLVCDDFKRYVVLYGKNAVLCGFLGMLAYMLSRGIGLSERWNIEKGCASIRRALWVFLFLTYMSMVFELTILSRNKSQPSRVNVVPFATFSGSGWDRKFFCENVLLFFPLPIFLYMGNPVFRKFKSAILEGMFVSLLIETLQYFLKCGWCDIDDVLTNTLGSVLGWVVIHGIYRLREWN